MTAIWSSTRLAVPRHRTEAAAQRWVRPSFWALLAGTALLYL